MAGEGRSASTRNASIREPEAKSAATATKTSTPGTGQHVKTFSGSGKITERGATISRADDRPSKKGEVPGPSSKDERTTYSKQSQALADSQRTTTAPEPSSMPSYVMYRDDAPKSSRERGFSSWVSDNQEHLIGSDERAFFPTALERGTQAEIAKGDKYAGTASKVSKPKNQAQ